MRPVAILLCLLMLCACSRRAIPVRSERSDTVALNRYLRIETRIQYVPVMLEIAPQRYSQVVPSSDTSHLETDVAESNAYLLPDGRLHHDLSNKPQQREQIVPVPVTDTMRVDSVRHSRQEIKEVPVPMPLTKWQQFWIRSGKIGWTCLLLILGILGVRVIRKITL